MSATQIPLKLSFAIVGDLSSSDTMFNCFCGEGATWPISLRGGPLMNTSSPSLCYVGPSENEKHVRKIMSVVSSRRSIMRCKKIQIHCLVWAIGCWYLSTVSSFILPVKRSKVVSPICQSDLRPYQTTFLIWDTCYSQNPCKDAIKPRQFPAVYSVGDDFVEAEDLEALQSLFRKYCDSDGLMTSQSVQKVPSIAQLLVSALRTALRFFTRVCR